jgi:hypothetical protein
MPRIFEQPIEKAPIVKGRIASMGLILPYVGDSINENNTILHYVVEKLDSDGNVVETKQVALKWEQVLPEDKDHVRAIFASCLNHATMIGELPEGDDINDL